MDEFLRALDFYVASRIGLAARLHNFEKAPPSLMREYRSLVQPAEERTRETQAALRTAMAKLLNRRDTGSMVASEDNPADVRLRHTIWKCLSCVRITILRNDSRRAMDCDCGSKFYPVSTAVVMGKAMTVEEVAGEALGGIWVLHEDTEAQTGGDDG